MAWLDHTEAGGSTAFCMNGYERVMTPEKGAAAFWYDFFLQRFNCFYQKSVNLKYITLGHLDDGTNESSTKRMMFQALFFFHDFLQNSLQKSIQFIFLFFFIKLQK